jgi:hypothetical protein
MAGCPAERTSRRWISEVITVVHTSGAPAPWTGLGVLALYAVAVIMAATALITRRDA